MIDGLKLINLPSQYPLTGIELERSFVLQTCQRTLVVGHHLQAHKISPLLAQAEVEFFSDAKAYHFLLETICGLKSQVLAESEITAQFKSAYQDYLKKEKRSSHLMNVLEKLFKDAKEIRTHYLLEIGQQSYAGITRKLLTSRVKERRPVLIIGSGNLARDILKNLNRRFDVMVSARNQEKVRELTSHYQTPIVQWKDRDAWLNSALIVNTVGADEILFDSYFFEQWRSLYQDQRLFIDLSSPSVIETSLTKRDGVIRLEDVFSHGVILSEEKQRKVTQARQAIEELVVKRQQSFGLHFPFGWEEMSFA